MLWGRAWPQTYFSVFLHHGNCIRWHYFVCHNFSPRLHKIPNNSRSFSGSVKFPEYSRFSRFMATMWNLILHHSYKQNHSTSIKWQNSLSVVDDISRKLKTTSYTIHIFRLFSRHSKCFCKVRRKIMPGFVCYISLCNKMNEIFE